jgi:asparagine synthetase B (glutamine-hydrolysing)
MTQHHLSGKETLNICQPGTDEDIQYLIKKYCSYYQLMQDKQFFQIKGNTDLVIDLKQKRFTNLKQGKDSHGLFGELKPIDCFNSFKAVLEQTDILFKESVTQMISNVPVLQEAKHSNISILFSGGIDCLLLAHTLLTLFKDKHLMIDLVNLSFIGNKAPDRKNSILSFKKLKQLFPEQQFQLVLVDGSTSDLEQLEKKVVDLISPLENTLDFNLGFIFKLSSLGKGKIYKENTPDDELEEYQSPSRIYFSGVGADEYFGGYSRHKSAYTRYK